MSSSQGIRHNPCDRGRGEGGPHAGAGEQEQLKGMLSCWTILSIQLTDHCYIVMQEAPNIIQALLSNYPRYNNASDSAQKA